MGAYGDLCGFMGADQGRMENHGAKQPDRFIGTHGYPRGGAWGSMGTHGDPQGPMRTHAETRRPHGLDNMLCYTKLEMQTSV